MTTTGTRQERRTGISANARSSRGSSVRGSNRTFTVVSVVILVVFAIVWLVPSLFALKTSLSPNGIAALGAQEILTHWSPTLESYTTLLRQGDTWNWYLSSAITSVVTAVLTLLFASMAALDLSRLTFRGKAFIYLLIIIGLITPS